MRSLAGTTLFFAFIMILLVPVSGCDIFSRSLPVGGAKDTEKELSPENNSDKKENKGMSEIVVITTRHGVIKVKFFDDLAPKHAESFLKLAKDGYFDGTTFHRVIPGFMIQGGDPLTKDENNRNMHGTGGPGYTIDAEFSDKKHTRGVLSAARSQDPNSAGSQFFLCVADSPWLDNQYSIFGEVIEGMDVADKIVDEKRDARDNPLERVEMTVTVEAAAE